MVMPERTWTPWRMRYLTGGAREEGCVFCNRLHGDNDVASLILHRVEHCFVIMNLFPYGSGHVMILPNQHVGDPAELDQATRHEMADLLPMLTTVLKRTMNCEGFNTGFNLGVAGGAGIAEHLHQHVVPRWIGDANFMPIIASTKPIPELLPTGYAKIRAEIERDVLGPKSVPVVVLLDDDRGVLVRENALPVAEPQPGVAVWRSAIESIRDSVSDVEVAGWAGSVIASAASQPGLIIRGSLRPDADGESLPVADSQGALKPEHCEILTRALDQLAPRG
jgi:ATP adenylyltransferase